MSARTHYLAVAIAALGGVLAGVVIGPRLIAGKHDDSRGGVDVVPTIATDSRNDDDQRRMAALESRLQRMEAAKLMARDQPEQTPPPKANPPDVPPEAARARFMAQIENRRARHDNEPVDAAWASTTAPSLRTDLHKLGAPEGGAGFQVKGVECKTTSCAAALLFPGYESASAESARLLHGMYSQPCGTTVFMPEPDDPKAPYAVTLYFECDGRT